MNPAHIGHGVKVVAFGAAWDGTQERQRSGVQSGGRGM